MSNKANQKKSVIGKVQGVPVPLKWIVPANIVTKFASNVVVQLLEDEFKISFFEINPDIQMGLDNEIPDEVEAYCVASVIISAPKLSSFIDVLQRQKDIYEKLKSNP